MHEPASESEYDEEEEDAEEDAVEDAVRPPWTDPSPDTEDIAASVQCEEHDRPPMRLQSVEQVLLCPNCLARPEGRRSWRYSSA